MQGFVDSDEALVVLGSQNAHQSDRYLERSEISPLQVILQDGIHVVTFFDTWGDLGIASMAWHPHEPLVLYITTGSNLQKVDLDTGDISSIKINNLRDVHELSVIGNTLWLANTGNDEVISLDLENERVTKRIRLRDLNSAIGVVEPPESGVEIVEKYHCNQVFEGFDGDLYVLVHHVNGLQKLRYIAKRVIKQQGEGGAINLRTGKRIPLSLSAPHSVRKVKDHYWLFDSANATINVYTREWRLETKIATAGYGRGADYSTKQGLFYAGISETRRRYLQVIGRQSPNMVEVFSAEDKVSIGKIVLSNVEQVNNVYVISHDVALRLLRLR